MSPAKKELSEKQIHDAYRALFRPEQDAMLYAAQIVVKDLRRWTGAELPRLVQGLADDPRIDAYNQGLRAVFYYLMWRVKLTDEEMDEMSLRSHSYLEPRP